MLEFARAHWLWLFALALVLFAAWRLARRFRPHRVTYGQVWHAVSRKLQPPGWKRLVRTALTWLIAALILACAVLYAAGLQRAESDRPAPLLIAIAIDSTPSMHARHNGRTRFEDANARAQEVVDALGPDDRAVVFRFERGVPHGSRWFKRGNSLGPAGSDQQVEPDFTQPDMSALARAVAALGAPPGVPLEPAPVHVLWWLGDDPPQAAPLEKPARLASVGVHVQGLSGLPMIVETFGASADNDAIIHARVRRETDGSGAMLIQAQARSPQPVTLTIGSTKRQGSVFQITPAELAAGVELRTDASDALALDDVVRLQVPTAELRDAALWHPAGEDPNELLLGALREMLPGRTISTGRAEFAPESLVIMDRAAPSDPRCRAAICFGVIPAAWGRVGSPVNARAGFQTALPGPRDYELPDLSLLSAQQAWPLLDSSLAPLLRDPMGNVLIAEGTVGQTRVLYCGFVPHLSTLLNDRGDLGGLLLLLRWLRAVQTPPDIGLPPVLNPGQTAELRLKPNTLYTLKADRLGAPAFTLATGPDGRGLLGPLDRPANWQILDEGGKTVGAFASVWADEREQSLPFEPLPRADLAALNPQRATDWRDLLPGLLLYVLLALVVLEWVLWLAGATE